MTTPTPPDALTLLRDDHQRIESQFEALARARDVVTRRAQLTRLRESLLLHASIEEDLFYPGLLDVAAVSSCAAAVEHGAIEGVLAALESMAPADSAFVAHQRVLRRLVMRHQQAEERELFVIAADAGLLDAAFDAALLQRRRELMDELDTSHRMLASAHPRVARRHARALATAAAALENEAGRARRRGE
jgi:hypothetical protein